MKVAALKGWMALIRANGGGALLSGFFPYNLSVFLVLRVCDSAFGSSC